LDNVYFPTKKSLLFKGPQQYRNLRAHFEALQNSPAASLMRAKELASERETDKGLSKFFNYIYFFVSNYGLSPGRPLWWLVIVYLSMVCFLFPFKEAGINIYSKYIEKPPPLKNVKSKRLLMKRFFLEEKMRDSLILPLQTMVNPAGIFRRNQITHAKTRTGKTVILFLSLIADGLIIFTIAGLRKRFKIY